MLTIEISDATIEEIKNSQAHQSVAFRASCAKNFPSGYSTSKSENPGESCLSVGY